MKLPRYKPDNGPLTDEQVEAIRKLSGLELSDTDFNKSILDEEEEDE